MNGAIARLEKRDETGMKLRKIWLMALMVVMLCTHMAMALGEDCFVIDVDTLDMNSLNSDEYVALHLTASAQGVRVRKYISDSTELAVPVRLTLFQMDTQTLLFDKDYGYQGGTFDSGVIYLPFLDNRTVPYLVTLYVADYVYAMPFMHAQARLMYNSACTYGVRLSDLDAALSADWLMGTMVDLDWLRQNGMMTLDLCASNQYVIGQAQVYMHGDQLCVQPVFFAQANVEVHSASLYVITRCANLTTGGLSSQPAYVPGEWVDVTGASSALIYMPMSVTYDPAGLNGFWYDLNALGSQLDLWRENRSAQDAPSDAWADVTVDPYEAYGMPDYAGWVDITPSPTSQPQDTPLPADAEAPAAQALPEPAPEAVQPAPDASQPAQELPSEPAVQPVG